MIRQADPNANVELMAPAPYVSEIKPIAEDFGGEMHDTGAMSGFWTDYLPVIARGSGLPCSLEPGGPATTPEDVRAFFGRWLTEGVDAVDWFIHIGDVVFPEHAVIKAYFDTHLPLLRAIGKSHVPRAEVAFLYSDRCARLTGWPWDFDAGERLESGFWNDQQNEGALRGSFPFDGLTESDFARGNADQYRVIADSNTQILDESQLADIERWIRAGGTFITYGDTGRDSSNGFDSWPISRLTGYQVIGRDIQGVTPPRPVTWVSQSLLSNGPWASGSGGGLRLRPVAPDCQELALWSDGSVAVGSRSLGLGRIIQVGTFDTSGAGGWGGSVRTADLLQRVCDRLGLAREPAVLSSSDRSLIFRHTVSNDGLYDLWTIYREHYPLADPSITTDIVIAAGPALAWCIEVNTGGAYPITTAPAGYRLANIAMAPLDTRMFKTPRADIGAAPLDWFRLQRSWWKGTTPASSMPLPTVDQQSTTDLNSRWAFKPLAVGDDGSAYAPTSIDDSGWEHRALGIWSVEHPGITHGVWRRRFTVPAGWNAGRVSLWCQANYTPASVTRSRVFVDGVLIRDWASDWGSNLVDETVGGSLLPGTEHLIVLDIAAPSSYSLAGPLGGCWLSYLADPQGSIDLSGTWTPYPDGVTPSVPVTLPGTLANALMAEKTFHVDLSLADRAIFTHFTVDLRYSQILDVIVNGHLLESVNHAGYEPLFRLNVTPWIRFGAENRIQIVPKPGGSTAHYLPAATCIVTMIRLDVCDPATATNDFASSPAGAPAGDDGIDGIDGSPGEAGGHPGCGFAGGFAILVTGSLIAWRRRGMRPIPGVEQ